MTPHVSSRHSHTIVKTFHHPAGGNIEWRPTRIVEPIRPANAPGGRRSDPIRDEYNGEHAYPDAQRPHIEEV